MSIALATALSRNLGRGSRWVAAATLPLIGAGFDYLENVAAWTMLIRYPPASGAAASVLGAASVVKQTVNWIAGLLLIIVLAYATARRMAKWRTRHVATSAN